MKPPSAHSQIDSSMCTTAAAPRSSTSTLPVSEAELLPATAAWKRKNPRLEWNHSTAKSRVKCNHCRTPYFCHIKGAGTSAMRQHLLTACNDPLMVSIAISMRRKFEKYWSKHEETNKILLLAIVLDPRYKLLFSDFFFLKLQQDRSKVPSMVKDIQALFLRMHNEYAAASSSVNPSYESANASSIDEDSHMHEFSQIRQEKDIVEIRNEVDKYLAEASEYPINVSFDLISWWKENEKRFPILSQMARDVFAVPASTVASEGVFSLGGRVLDPFWASLTPKMVEALVCIADWIKAGSSLWKDTTLNEMEQYGECEKTVAAESVVTMMEGLENQV